MSSDVIVVVLRHRAARTTRSRHHLGEADDGIQGRAQLVAHIGEEFGLGAVRLLCRLSLASASHDHRLRCGATPRAGARSARRRSARNREPSRSHTIRRRTWTRGRHWSALRRGRGKTIARCRPRDRRWRRSASSMASTRCCRRLLAEIKERSMGMVTSQARNGELRPPY